MRRKLLFLCALLVSSTMAWAESGTCGEGVTWEYADGKLTISGTGAMADYSHSNWRPWNGFYGNISSVVIGSGVTYIGENAFYSCGNITSVTFEAGSQLSRIGQTAFQFCNNPGFTSITFPNSLQSIDYAAFQRCDYLTNITIPANVTSIGNFAFAGCAALATATIWAPSLTTYGTSAFNNCNNLTTIYVPTAAAVTAYSTGWSAYTAKFVAMSNTLTANQVGEEYWCTYYNGYSNADVDANTKVYTVSVSGTNATLQEIEDGNIKAGEAVVLKSTASEITLTYNTTATTGDFTTNVLEGVDAQTTISTSAYSDKVIYTLANESGLGFYKYYDNVSAETYTTNTTLGANKAFLPLNAAAAAREFYLFSFDDNEMTTGVDEVRVKMKEGRSEYFNLKGQRVNKPAKGLYIKDGKKVVIK